MSRLTPRWYQQESHDSIFNYLKECKKNKKRGNPLIQIPTGGGKAFICAMVTNTIMKYPKQKVLVIIHTKELVHQNALEIKNSYPHLDVGVYSSGLGKKELKDVTVAGIQSISKKSNIFKGYTMVIVDECHRIDVKDKGEYRRFLNELDIPVIGMTATAYRSKKCYIHEHETALFTDMVYDLTSFDNFNRMFDDGFLCRLRTKETNLVLDLTGIHTKLGDFDLLEMSERIDRDEVTIEAVTEISESIVDRNNCLVFTIDVDHCTNVLEEFTLQGISARCVHSKMLDSERDKNISDFISGKFKVLVNVAILAVGFNKPDIDTIAFLRSTKQPGLFSQMCGRGLRVHESKEYCLVLDFGNCIKHCGSINDIKIGTKTSLATGVGDAVVKTCPKCKEVHHGSVRICNCGFEFEFKVNITHQASTDKIIKDSLNETYNITNVTYKRHKKEGSKDSMKVSYQCGMRRFSEWVSIDNPKSRNIALAWIRKRNGRAINLEELLYESARYPVPTKITVDETGKYPQIKKVEF